MTNIDVIVLGRSCLDYIAGVNRFPVENQKMPLEFRLKEGGGQGGTSSCCISRLGGHVAYVGKLGDDEAGRYCLKRLKDFDVGTGFVDIVKGGNTPVAYVFVTATSGERTIIYERNALPKITVDDRLLKLIGRAKVVLLDPETTYLGSQLKTVAEHDIKLVYDCERWREGVGSIMNLVDFFIPSSEFLESEELNFGDAPLLQKIIMLHKMMRSQLVVTHGEFGAFYVAQNKLYHIPAPKVKVGDTIGAGDNFHGAFALALSRGFDLDQSVKFSVAVASLSCREYGGRNGVPDWQQALTVAATLKKRYIATIWSEFLPKDRI